MAEGPGQATYVVYCSTCVFGLISVGCEGRLSISTTYYAFGGIRLVTIGQGTNGYIYSPSIRDCTGTQACCTTVCLPSSSVCQTIYVAF